MKNRKQNVFDDFIADYFGAFAFETITSEVFLDYLDEKLLSAHAGIVSRADVEEWLYEPGLPDDAPVPVSASLDAAANFAQAWSQGEIDIEDVPVSSWSPQGMIHFINNLDADLSEEQLVELDMTLGLSDTRNAEIGRTWFIQVAKRQYRPGYEKLEQYLNRYGRTRLVKPVYQALVENGSDAWLARGMFERARRLYHPITITSVELILE